MDRSRALAATIVLLLLVGCNPARDTNEVFPDNAVAPVAEPATAIRAGRPGEGVPEAAAAEVPEDGAGAVDMSPWQRRAYEKGYQDCAAGRYDPDPYPEAYRIGCGAAHERQAQQDASSDRQ